MRKVKFKIVKVIRKSIKVAKSNLNSYYVSCFAEGRYQRAYENNEIVEAEPGSLGIMVFEKRNQATEFITNHDLFPHSLLIKHVLPIGKGKKPPLISKLMNQEGLHEFYYRYAHFKKEWITVPLKTTPLNTPPEGTMCYPAVRVLD